jgi:SOS-response transcriptional repressor LexA
MTIGQRIRSARGSLGMTQKQLAEILGISVQAISQWESDKTVPTGDKLVRLGSVLGLDLRTPTGTGEPVEFRGPYFRRSTIVPLLSRVAAGNWSEAIIDGTALEEAVSFQIYWTPKGAAFALEIKGGSMLPEFDEGDLVFVDTGVEPIPGDYVVAAVEGESEATFKKYRPRGNDDNGQPVIELAPLNPDYPTLTISSRNPGRVVGTMMEHRRFRKRK